MDTSEDMEGMKKEPKQSAVENASYTSLSDEEQHLSIGEGTSNGCEGRSRPKLKMTKSFPPYSQCIGGLGEDVECDSKSDLDSTNTFQPSPENGMADKWEGINDEERKTEIKLTARCTRHEVKAKWRLRRKETTMRSHYDDLERQGGSGNRSMDETGEGSESDGGIWESKRKHWKDNYLSFEKSEEEKRGCPTEGKHNFLEEKDEKELPGSSEALSAHQWSAPHHILSKFLHSSSSTSSSFSSINLSSAESDEVISEGEDSGSKRKILRKCRSWKTFLTMMHLSLSRQSSWVQLAGHQGNFQVSKGGEVLKLYSKVEAECLDSLMRDPLRPFVPQYHGTVTREEHCYLRLEDLLSGLRRPVIMDCKMGIRTYKEEELTKAQTKPTLRSDMYQKMVKIDPSGPSPEDHEHKAVTKWRYLQWKDATCSTSTLGFRIEGIMMEDGSIQRDFRKIQTLDEATEAFLNFTTYQLNTLKAYHSRLLTLGDTLKISPFFRAHEVIGSSLLFVHDHNKASVWMIDFGKTTPMPDSRELRHDVPWVEGNREDGYLIGLNSLITCLNQAISKASSHQKDSCRQEKTI